MAEERKTVTGTSGAFSGVDPAKRFGAGFESLNWFSKAWIEWAGAMNAEFTQFVADRIQEDVRTQHALMHCREPAKLQEIQKAFFDKAVEDYSAERGKLMEIGTRFVERVNNPETAN